MLTRRAIGRLMVPYLGRRVAIISRARLATAATTFENGTNQHYSQEMYRAWRQDPLSVHASWNAYFSGLDKGLDSDSAFQPPPTLLNIPTPAGGSPALHVHGGQDLTDHLKVCSNYSCISHDTHSTRSNSSSVPIKFAVTISRISILLVF